MGVMVRELSKTHENIEITIERLQSGNNNNKVNYGVRVFVVRSSLKMSMKKKSVSIGIIVVLAENPKCKACMEVWGRGNEVIC